MTGVARLGGWVVTATVAAIAAPTLHPVDPSLHPVGEALAFGGIAGLALFTVLARRPVPAAAIAAAQRRRLLARTTVLTVKSVQEETVWRGVSAQRGGSRVRLSTVNGDIRIRRTG